MSVCVYGWSPFPRLLCEASHVVDGGEQRQVVLQAGQIVFLPVSGGSVHQTSACICKGIDGKVLDRRMIAQQAPDQCLQEGVGVVGGVDNREGGRM